MDMVNKFWFKKDERAIWVIFETIVDIYEIEKDEIKM